MQDQLRWFGPQDLEGGDEIEMLGTIKVETNEDVANTNSVDLIIRFLFFYFTYLLFVILDSEPKVVLYLGIRFVLFSFCCSRL